MKTLKFFIITFLSLTLFISCSNEDFLQEESIDNLNVSARGPQSIPFKADFFTKRNYDNVGVGFCTEDPYLDFNHQVGEGKATHLGNIDVTMSFCGAGFDYKNGTGVFVAANGDELYIKVPSEGEIGHVILDFENLQPYEAYFQDPFSFDGGTGRFVGATGGGMTNSFVDLFNDEGEFIFEHRTDHIWTGKLLLPFKNK